MTDDAANDNDAQMLEAARIIAETFVPIGIEEERERVVEFILERVQILDDSGGGPSHLLTADFLRALARAIKAGEHVRTPR